MSSSFTSQYMKSNDIARIFSVNLLGSIMFMQVVDVAVVNARMYIIITKMAMCKLYRHNTRGSLFDVDISSVGSSTDRVPTMQRYRRYDLQLK